MRSGWLTLLVIVAVTVLVTGPILAQTSGSGSSTQGSGGTTTSPQPTPSPTQPGTPLPSVGSDPSKPATGTPQTGAGKAPSGQVGSGAGTAGSKPSGATNGMAGSEEVKSLQKALQDKGKDPGPIDGLMGPKTQAALREFQKAEKLPETGRADAKTLEKLGVSR
jgi:peptidoglycan hydrolase-like protein with peptidoglycan-binding domain